MLLKHTLYYNLLESRLKLFLVCFGRMSREQQAVARARKAFETGRSKSLEYRIMQLKNLQRLLMEREKEIAEAMKKDLNKVTTLFISNT